jgi:hypothetical protein
MRGYAGAGFGHGFANPKPADGNWMESPPGFSTFPIGDDGFGFGRLSDIARDMIQTHIAKKKAPSTGSTLGEKNPMFSYIRIHWSQT